MRRVRILPGQAEPPVVQTTKQKRKTRRSFLELYREAGRVTGRLWPLYLWQAGFDAVRGVTFLVVLLFSFWPLLRTRADFVGADLRRFSDSLLSLLWHSGWWKVGLMALVAYAAFWLLLEAFLNGGVYGALWAHLRRGDSYSTAAFLDASLRHFLPLLWAHLVLGLLLGLLLGGSAAFGTGLVVSMRAARSAETVGMVLLLIGGILALSLALLLVSFYWLSLKACLTGGRLGPFSEAFRALRRSGWRLLRGLLAAWATATAILLVFGGAAEVFELLPVVGPFFTLLNLVVNFAAGVFLGVYLPAVTNLFLLEEEASA